MDEDDVRRDSKSSVEFESAAMWLDGVYTDIGPLRDGVRPRGARPKLGLFDCAAAPCSSRCPLGVDIPSVAALAAEGCNDEALALLLDACPLPNVMAEACPRPCEDHCVRAAWDEPLDVAAIVKKILSDGAPRLSPLLRVRRRVAVVGAGPSGLSASSVLARAGADVTVFERTKRVGGMMALAPSFRFDSSAIERDAEILRGLGVKFVTDCDIGSPVSLLRGHDREGEFDAVYLANGFPAERMLNIDNIEAKGVISALSLLSMFAEEGRRTNGTSGKPLSGNVLVVGGGRTALDAGRAALRMTDGLVTVVYRRTAEDMTAPEGGVEAFLNEGGRIEYLALPVRVITSSGNLRAAENPRTGTEGETLIGLECVRCTAGELDVEGQHEFIPSDERFVLDADTLVIAAGLEPDRDVGVGLSLRRNGSVTTYATGRTSCAGVYAGGSTADGPTDLLSACASGARAARSICSDLGIPVAAERNVCLPCRDPIPIPSQRLDDTPSEAARCLQCSSRCRMCVDVCPNKANAVVLVAPSSFKVPILRINGDAAAVVGSETLTIRHVEQVVHIADMCEACGRCARFCPQDGRPYERKLGLCLSDEMFERCVLHDAWRFAGGVLMRRVHGGRVMRLMPNDVAPAGDRLCRHGGDAENVRGWIFDDGDIRAEFDRFFRMTSATVLKKFDGVRSLLPAAEMRAVYDAVKSF